MTRPGTSGEAGDHAAVDLGQYCREIEAYLCARNQGHLIRIAGPTFDRVKGWAARGIPLAIVRRGIDRYVERGLARGPRRRPVPLDFCEADVLDLFDEWRRAVGVRETGDGAAGEEDEGGVRAGSRSLPAHLERVTGRLTALGAAAAPGQAWAVQLDRVLRELDDMQAGARGLRGEARRAVLDRLRELDRGLLEAARARVPADARDALAREAADELRPFAARMPPDQYARAFERALDRLVRDREGLPTIALGE